MSKPSAAARPAPPPQATEDSDESDKETEDENDPFADRNEVQTPKGEKEEPKW